MFDYYTSAVKKYAVFEGRASLKEYWMFMLFNAIFMWTAYILDNIMGTSFKIGSVGDVGYGWIYSLYALAILLPSIGLLIRRLHDVGKSGWYWFIVLIPIAGAIWFIVLMVTDGNLGANKYGPNPKDDEFSYDYFPQGKLLIVKDRLEGLDTNKINIVQTADYDEPKTMLAISILMGFFGVDRFLLGDTGMGVLKLLTFGLCGILWIIDIFNVQRKAREKNFEKLMAIA
jgi:uncharacterized membrane protein YhaH (DUF805 family)